LDNWLSQNFKYDIEGAQQLMTGAHTKLSGSEAYNYSFYPPRRLSIYENSMTIRNSIKLSDLLVEKMGRLDWAACTEVVW
jgi:hypothetical protein